MNNLQQLMPGIPSEEIAVIAPSTSRLGEEKLRAFAAAYMSERRNPTTTLLLNLFTYCGHRFYIGQTGMGFVYLFTLGLVGFGSLIDLFRFRALTNEANRAIAGRIALNLG